MRPALALLTILLHLLPVSVLGNVRVTADAAGNVLERNDYYPYGGLFGETGDLQPLKYSGKELERENGLNMYDFHARQFDYAIPAFSSQDPLQEKYRWFSPYSYCAANPIRFIDPSGMDLCVLLQPDGAKGAGHMAILIQNENGTWSLWSKNGTNDKSGMKGDSVDDEGNDNDEKAFGEYKSAEDFLDGKDNKNNQTDEKSETIKYTMGYLITATPEEDKAARNAAENEIDKVYSLIGANCATMVQTALTAAGKDPGVTLNKGSLNYESTIIDLIPKVIFLKITYNNPGTLITF